MSSIRQRKRGKNEVDESEKETALFSYNDNALPTISSIGFILGFLVFLKCIIIFNQRLPPLLKVADEAAYPERFIGERAENDLLKLVALGPKVTGSYECEVLAVRILRQEIAVIAQTANPMHLLQQDLQRPKGSFHMALKPHGFQSLYENIQNIAVRLGPRPPSSHSVLVNCHFDTVPESPGASDNGLNCAVMLEILRKMSRLPNQLKHNVIFLFNGAEENVLQAAHGFITKHSWSKEVRVVVNLDAGGAGGRELLFQAAPDHQWLLRTYARVALHPYASMAGQELFDSGMVPSDTDYRIFRDFGPIPGIDIAHIDNGYIYHTRLDTMDYIASGVYQHTGDNILALLQALANAPELEDMTAASRPGSKVVYYDLFGLTMLVYNYSTAFVINILTVLLALTAVWKIFSSLPKVPERGFSTLVTAVRCTVLSNVLGVASNILIAVVLDRTGAALSWYAHPHYIIPLYVFPYVAAALLPWTRNETGGIQASLEYLCGGQVITAFLLLLLTASGIRSSYLLMLLIIAPAIAGIFSTRVKSLKCRLLLLMATNLVGVAVYLSNVVTFYTVLIPIVGRSGSTINPEFIIGGLNIISCLPVGNALIPFLLSVRKPWSVVRGLGLVHLVTIALVIFTPLGFPYSGDLKSPALQRFYIYHTEQRLYDINGSIRRNESGVFILPMDRNRMKYIAAAVPELKNVAPVNCNEGLLCQFPLYNSRHVNPAKTSVWMQLPPPQIHYPTSLELLEKTELKAQERRLKFKLKGPDHMTLVISPRDGVQLSNWTLGQGRRPASYEGRDYFVIYYSDGHMGDVSTFSLDLKANSAVNGPWLDMSIIGHYQHQKATYTAEFKDLLQKFPPWAHTTSWVSTVHGFVF